MPEANVESEAKIEEKAVKTELKEDAEASPPKKRTRKAGDPKDEAKVGQKAEKEEVDDQDEPGNEDGMAPEAEPSELRNEVAPGAKFRQDSVHVYGLDFLKTGHMEEIFGQFNHRYIEWINDSSANVVFRDAASARKALESLSYPKAGDDPWRRTPDILVHDDLPAVFLQMRLAAPSDTKDKKRAVPSVNPPAYTPESDRRPPQFTMASLYDRKERTKDAGEAVDGKTPKRAAKVLPEAEVAKRSKRAERFAATLGEAPAAAEPEVAEPEVAEPEAAAAPAPASEQAPAAEGSAAPGSNAAEEAAQEADRRQKRAARFGSAPAEGSSDAAGAKEDAATPRTDAVASSSDAVAPSTNEGVDAELPKGDADPKTDAPAASS